MRFAGIIGFIGVFALVSGFFVVMPVISIVSAQEQEAEQKSMPAGGTAPLWELVTKENPLFDISAELATARVDTSSAGLVTKVAPGELLPVSVRLLNFGGGRRVDVQISYGVFSDDGKRIYSTIETVAVETTASFVKTLQIPLYVLPGTYTVQTSITYEGQVTPAGSQFTFSVERKIAGLFQSSFFFYAGIVAMLSTLIALMCVAFIRRRNARLAPFDYSVIPRDERIFYELTSDAIAQIRQRVGDRALLIASRVEGLKIDRDSGRVLALTSRPGKILADLVSEYEKMLGQKVSFSFPPKDTPKDTPKEKAKDIL